MNTEEMISALERTVRQNLTEIEHLQSDLATAQAALKAMTAERDALKEWYEMLTSTAQQYIRDIARLEQQLAEKEREK